MTGLMGGGRLWGHGFIQEDSKTHEQRYSAVYGRVEPSRVMTDQYCNDDDEC